MPESIRPPKLQAAESMLAEWFGREQCVMAGRATTALYALFAAAGVENRVVFPAYTCPSPVYAAVYAGVKPTFCDVKLDYTIDPDALIGRIGPDTDAVVAIDMFGHPVDYDPVVAACKRDNILLIEDACQSIGTTYQGNKAGQFGDVCLLSFNNGKPIDAGGGGAILTDDQDLAEAVRDRLNAIPARDPDRQAALYDHYRRLYYEIQDLREVTPRAEYLFARLPRIFKELYIKSLSHDRPAAVLDALDGLVDDLATRQRHADLYRKHLSHQAVTHPSPMGSPVYYRYSVALPDRRIRDQVVEHIRQQGFHASTLYDQVHRRFGSDESFETAADLTARTLNLWVGPEVNKSYVRDCSSEVHRALEECNE